MGKVDVKQTPYSTSREQKRHHRSGWQADAELSGIMRRLRNAETAESAQAEKELIALIERESRAFQKRKRDLGYAIAIYIVSAFSTLAFAEVTHSSPMHLLLVVIAFVFIGYGIAFQLRQGQTARRLAGIDDIRALGPILDTLQFTGMRPSRYRITRDALLRLLPRLNAGDSARLTPRQRKVLYRLLKSDVWWLVVWRKRWGVDLRVAVLRALEQVGDAEAVPHVEHLAQAARNPQIRQAALECLPFLYARGHGDQTLLRPTLSSPEESLLHPVLENVESPPQFLLRPRDQQDQR